MVDETRTVTVEFLATVNSSLRWEFAPVQARMEVHPGEVYEATYLARNLDDAPAVGQAIPSVSPIVAAPHLRKTECFCFTEQRFEQGEEREYRIVGADELDPGKGWISMDSPMAKALIQKALDDEVTVETPEGRFCYIVTGVRYQPD